MSTHFPFLPAVALGGIVSLTGVAPVLAADCEDVAAVPGEAITLELVSNQLTSPLDLAAPPGDPGRLFVCEKLGRIRVIDRANDSLRPTAFLDIRDRIQSDGDRGVQSVAFHPKYAENGYFFVHYSNRNGNNTFSRFQVSATDPEVAESASERVLIAFPHALVNHNGGKIAFSPRDGYLYLTSGDGGRQHDPEGNAQNPLSFLGKILRIDVDTGDPYAIPRSNPFRGRDDVLEEIWALGLRNPWRMAFDSANGDLYVADVGQDLWEEVIFEPGGSAGGKNYEWNFREGNHNHAGSAQSVGTRLGAVFDYSHGQGILHGCSISGGEVYRGCRMPDLQGRYFLADYCNHWVASFRVQNGVADDVVDHTTAFRNGIAPATLSNIIGFAADGVGELYVLALPSSVYRIIPETQINNRPTARITSTPSPANVHLSGGQATVKLDGSASDDGNGGAQRLTYNWTQTSGPPAQVLAPDQPITDVVVTALGIYHVRLTVSDGEMTHQATATISAQDDPPVPKILSPKAGASFDAGQKVELEGRALDAEDGELDATQLSWDITLHHADHTHPWASELPGANASLEIPLVVEEHWSFQVVLTATDSAGQSATKDVTIGLNYIPVKLRSEPPSLTLLVEGNPRKTPATFTTVRGATLRLTAPSPQRLPGEVGAYVLDSWSDGGAPTHEATATDGLILTATFVPELANDHFLRGDSNRDGRVDLTDVLYTLGYLFLGGPIPPCADAADANDSGVLDITDPVMTLGMLFTGGNALPLPTGEPGPDPTTDGLSCVK